MNIEEAMEEIGMGNGKVYLGIPRERMFLNQFVDNRDIIIGRLQETGLYCGHYQKEGHRVDRNRDDICWEFLHHPEKPEWLAMIDTDMNHPVTAIERLIAHKKPVVGALYFHRGEEHHPFVFREAEPGKDRYGRMGKLWAPMRDEVYDFLMENGVPLRDGAVVIDDCAGDPLIECDAVATGCIVIHRSVIEKMQAPWFEYLNGGNSEDLIFCERVKKELDLPVYCDLSTICGHFNWVPMGQVQFRIKYEGRGINRTTFSKREASKWLKDCFGYSEEEALKKIEEGNAHMVGDLWNKRFGDERPSRVDIANFYEDKETGAAYVIELLHWNYTAGFNALRQMLIPVRGLNVIEIGGGIGTVSLQLLIQKNNVLCVEPNPVLRGFIDYRYRTLLESLETGLKGFSICGTEWTIGSESRSFDVAVAFDVFEHLHPKELERTLEALSRVLKAGGHLYFHNNWGQQDLYPMHIDHSGYWGGLLEREGFLQISEYEALKVR